MPYTNYKINVVQILACISLWNFKRFLSITKAKIPDHTGQDCYPTLMLAKFFDFANSFCPLKCKWRPPSTACPCRNYSSELMTLRNTSDESPPRWPGVWDLRQPIGHCRHVRVWEPAFNMVFITDCSCCQQIDERPTTLTAARVEINHVALLHTRPVAALAPHSLCDNDGGNNTFCRPLSCENGVVLA